MWGWNNTGQLGIADNDQVFCNTVKSYPYPTLIDLYDENKAHVDINIKDIACGSRHSAILLTDNSLWTCGFNKYGQLGLSPENVQILHKYKKVYKCDMDCTISCGPWSTFITNDR